MPVLAGVLWNCQASCGARRIIFFGMIRAGTLSFSWVSFPGQGLVVLHRQAQRRLRYCWAETFQ
jgi:hypothetical protein